MLFYDIHGLNWSVTSLTFNAADIDVLCVVEISQVRKIMNANPLNWFIIFVCRRYFGYFTLTCQRSSFDLVMTVHTNINGRYSSILPLRYTNVAILTVDFILASVDFV